MDRKGVCLSNPHKREGDEKMSDLFKDVVGMERIEKCKKVK